MDKDKKDRNFVICSRVASTMLPTTVLFFTLTIDCKDERINTYGTLAYGTIAVIALLLTRVFYNDERLDN